VEVDNPREQVLRKIAISFDWLSQLVKHKDSPSIVSYKEEP
jgi:hypothetical protein